MRRQKKTNFMQLIFLDIYIFRAIMKPCRMNIWFFETQLGFPMNVIAKLRKNTVFSFFQRHALKWIHDWYSLIRNEKIQQNISHNLKELKSLFKRICDLWFNCDLVFNHLISGSNYITCLIIIHSVYSHINQHESGLFEVIQFQRLKHWMNQAKNRCKKVQRQRQLSTVSFVFNWRMPNFTNHPSQLAITINLLTYCERTFYLFYEFQTKSSHIPVNITFSLFNQYFRQNQQNSHTFNISIHIISVVQMNVNLQIILFAVLNKCMHAVSADVRSFALKSIA